MADLKQLYLLDLSDCPIKKNLKKNYDLGIFGGFKCRNSYGVLVFEKEEGQEPLQRVDCEEVEGVDLSGKYFLGDINDDAGDNG